MLNANIWKCLDFLEEMHLITSKKILSQCSHVSERQNIPSWVLEMCIFPESRDTQEIKIFVP